MAKISVSATGPGVSPVTMMLYLGMMFAAVGAVIGIGGIIGAVTTGDPA